MFCFRAHNEFVLPVHPAYRISGDSLLSSETFRVQGQESNPVNMQASCQSTKSQVLYLLSLVHFSAVRLPKLNSKYFPIFVKSDSSYSLTRFKFITLFFQHKKHISSSGSQQWHRRRPTPKKRPPQTNMKSPPLRSTSTKLERQTATLSMSLL